LLRSAGVWGVSTAERDHRLMLAVFATLGTAPDIRVGNPRHIVVYRVANDGVVEIVGMAHDRMLLARAARRMRREAGP